MNTRLPQTKPNSGFTLIELSIVLVIIGLIVGGVLVGQDLIKAAEIRATVSQIEKYNAAVNTFRGKYNGLPGDLANGTNFFPSITNSNESAQGDGDGLVEGTTSANSVCTTHLCVAGESAVFWYELSQAGMVPDAITAASLNYETYNLTPVNAVPSAKMGKGAMIAVMSVGGVNYFAISNLGGATALTTGGLGTTFTAAMTPVEAVQIDNKIDDGKPATGVTLSVAKATALPATAAGGAATGSVTAGDCYDSTTGYYATADSDSFNTLGCSLSIRASF